MANSDYFKTLLSVLRRPAMFGVQDVLDLRAFLEGYMCASKGSDLSQLQGDLTTYMKKDNPEFGTAGWAHIMKAQSYERGGTLSVFENNLGWMMLENGHWNDDQFHLFTSKGMFSEEEWLALPPPKYPASTETPATGQ